MSGRNVNNFYEFKKIEGQNRIVGELKVDTSSTNESGIKINDNENLGSHIPGVSYIHLQREKGIIYDYTIHVDAHCPTEYNSLELKFRDSEGDGDVYHLSILSRTSKWHTVNFNSKKPNIVDISWEYKK